MYKKDIKSVFAGPKIYTINFAYYVNKYKSTIFTFNFLTVSKEYENRVTFDKFMRVYTQT